MIERDPIERSSFLALAGLFQCGMLCIALGLAAWLQIDLWVQLEWQPMSLVAGSLAALPLCALSLWIQHSQWQPFRDIRAAWQESLTPLLLSCHRSDMIVLSLMVGISEELLFRGVLQSWLATHHFWGALLLTNLLFGLAHAVTRVYVVLAASVGLYFSAIMWLFDPPNLWTPILAHALCDLFAFEMLRRESSRVASQPD